MNKIWNLICLTIGCLTESVWTFLISVTSSGSQLTSLQDLLGLVKYTVMRCRGAGSTPFMPTRIFTIKPNSYGGFLCL